MSSIPSVEWINVASCPPSHHMWSLLVPTGINKHNFIVLQPDDDVFNYKKVHKYNIDTNKWTTTKCNPIPSSSYYSTTLDPKQNVLYYLHKNHLMQVDRNNNKITSYENNCDSTSKCIFINNELFIVGHSISKWNAETKQLTQMCSSYNSTLLDVGRCIHDNKTNSILTFGGYDNTNRDYVDYILQYDLNTNKRNKLPVSLPSPMSCDFCLAVINNQFVLIFGGYNMRCNPDFFDDIYIYSINTQTIKTSKIKCPSENNYAGIIVNDKTKDEKCVFGFVRNTWKICQIENHYFPPFYLLKLIHKYYLNEWVYLLDKSDGKQYKMSTLDIVG